eukprot:2256368-Pyramimonas_sp.AAC.1
MGPRSDVLGVADARGTPTKRCSGCGRRMWPFPLGPSAEPLMGPRNAAPGVADACGSRPWGLYVELPMGPRSVKLGAADACGTHPLGPS